MIPTFDENGNAFAPAGSTIAANGIILHPLQKVGVIPVKGSARFRGIGTSVNQAVRDLQKIPNEDSGHPLD